MCPNKKYAHSSMSRKHMKGDTEMVKVLLEFMGHSQVGYDEARHCHHY